MNCPPPIPNQQTSEGNPIPSEPSTSIEKPKATTSCNQKTPDKPNDQTTTMGSSHPTVEQSLPKVDMQSINMSQPTSPQLTSSPTPPIPSDFTDPNVDYKWI